MTYDEIMKLTKVEISEYIRLSYPRNARSFSYRKKLCGIGNNDADYITSCMIDGHRMACPAYRCWIDMIGRCYSSKRQDADRYYVGVTVVNEWLNFMKFREWWILNHKEGCQLDKDILSEGSKIYGPDNCVYVPSWMNTFTNNPKFSNHQYLIGVSYDKKRGKFQTHKPISKTGMRRRSPVLFNTEQEAYEMWLSCKLEMALEYKSDMDSIDLRIYPRVVDIIKNAK